MRPADGRRSPNPLQDDVLDVLREAAAAVARSLVDLPDWGLSGRKFHQYKSDIVADDAITAVLEPRGMGILSEETGLRAGGDDALVVVVDPVDGSTNASCRVPWYATSLCAVDEDGARAAVVMNLATGESFEAVRGQGAWTGDVRLAPSEQTDLAKAIVGLSGYPLHYLGWSQYRALGAAALDLCLVGAGRLDAYVDCSFDSHGVWDYAGAMLICQEAGATIVDAQGRDLLVLDVEARRTPVAAGTASLLDEVLARRKELDRTV